MKQLLIILLTISLFSCSPTTHQFKQVDVVYKNGKLYELGPGKPVDPQYFTVLVKPNKPLKIIQYKSSTKP